MAKVETFRCDQCGKQKQETNHWYMAYVNGLGCLSILNWDEQKAEVSRHLCGQACVVSELNSWMNSAKPTEL